MAAVGSSNVGLQTSYDFKGFLEQNYYVLILLMSLKGWNTIVETLKH